MFKIVELKYINSGVCRESVSLSKTLGETKESKKRKSECLHLGPWDLGELRIQLNFYEVEPRFQVRLNCAGSSPIPTPNDANEITMSKTPANQRNPDEGKVLRICPALPWTWDKFDQRTKSDMNWGKVEVNQRSIWHPHLENFLETAIQ